MGHRVVSVAVIALVTVASAGERGATPRDSSGDALSVAASSTVPSAT
ncbi:hypothetical protein [Dactylosporangium sp. CA-092794]